VVEIIEWKIIIMAIFCTGIMMKVFAIVIIVMVMMMSLLMGMPNKFNMMVGHEIMSLKHHKGQKQKKCYGSAPKKHKGG
jgi:cell division protein FtsL